MRQIGALQLVDCLLTPALGPEEEILSHQIREIVVRQDVLLHDRLELAGPIERLGLFADDNELVVSGEAQGRVW